MKTIALLLSLTSAASAAHAADDSASVRVRNSSYLATEVLSPADASAALQVSVSVPAQEMSHLPAFAIAGRSERVRFFTSGEAANLALVEAGEGANKVSQDPIRRGYESQFAASGNSSLSSGATQDKLIVKNNKASLIVQPAAIMCYTDLLKVVIQAGKDPRVVQLFNDFRIDEVNLYLKPVVSSKMMSRKEISGVRADAADLNKRQEALSAEYKTIKARFDDLTAYLNKVKDPAAYDKLSDEDKAKIPGFQAEVKTLGERQGAINTEYRNNTSKLELLKPKLELASVVISEDDTRLEISRVAQQRHDPALNLQIPFVTDTAKFEEQCLLPSVKDVVAGIQQAGSSAFK